MNGICTPVGDLNEDLVNAISGYYKLFALCLDKGRNEDFMV